MRNFWVALAVLAAIEVTALLLTIQNLIGAISGGRALSIRDVLGAIAVVGLPPLVAWGLHARSRVDRVRRAAIARAGAASPDSVVFAASPTLEFIAAINRIKAVSGSAPLAPTRAPLVIVVSKAFLSISTMGPSGTMVPGILIPASMISAVTVDTQPVPGSRGMSRLQCLRLRIADGKLDLVIPVQTDGLNLTTPAEAASLARAVSDRIGLTAPSATLLASDGSWQRLG